MSTQYGKLISLILLEHFGKTVQKVGFKLFKLGPASLRATAEYTKLPVSKVKIALCVLVKHGFVSYKPSMSGLYGFYQLLPDRVLLILRYPRFVAHIKKLFGEEAEMLVEENLMQGYATHTELILKSAKRIQDAQNKEPNLVEIRDKFVALVTAKYLMRYGLPVEKKPVPVIEVPDTERFLAPDINIPRLVEMRKGNNVESSAKEMYWCVNFDRFHQDFRDKLIMNATGKRFDDNACELMQIIMEQMYIKTEPWEKVSNAITFVEIQDIIRKLNRNVHLKVYLEHYLTVMIEDESQFLSRVGDSGGGQYVVNLKTAVIQLCLATIEKIILEKFNHKAARIFRLVRVKKYIEPENVHPLVMIPAKEAKRLLYKLLESNFIQIKELRKPASNVAPTKSFILFYINLDQVVPLVLELCYKCLYNSMTKRQHDKNINRRIIEKKHRVDTISMSLKAQGVDQQVFLDIEELITPTEKDVLDKIGKTMKTLNLGEMEIDETIFLLQLYIRYIK